MPDELDQWRVSILRDAVRFMAAEVAEPMSEDWRDIIQRAARAVLRRTADGYEGELEDDRRHDRMPILSPEQKGPTR